MRPSGVPLARAVVLVPALPAAAEVVRGGRHGYRQAQRVLGADRLDVMHGPARHPDDVVLARLDDDAAGELPGELARHHHPPLVEVGVPVRAIAPAGPVGDERDEIALVLDDPARPRRRAHLGDDFGDARAQHVGPIGARSARRRGAGREVRNGARGNRHGSSYSTRRMAASIAARSGSAACSKVGLYGTGTGAAQTRCTGDLSARNVAASSVTSAMISDAAEHVAGASSTTTRRPVRRTEARMAAASIGTSVRGSSTSTEMPSFASDSATASASRT